MFRRLAALERVDQLEAVGRLGGFRSEPLPVIAHEPDVERRLLG